MKLKNFVGNKIVKINIYCAEDLQSKIRRKISRQFVSTENEEITRNCWKRIKVKKKIDSKLWHLRWSVNCKTFSHFLRKKMNHWCCYFIDVKEIKRKAIIRNQSSSIRNLSFSKRDFKKEKMTPFKRYGRKCHSRALCNYHLWLFRVDGLLLRYDFPGKGGVSWSFQAGGGMSKRLVVICSEAAITLTGHLSKGKDAAIWQNNETVSLVKIFLSFLTFFLATFRSFRRRIHYSCTYGVGTLWREKTFEKKIQEI